MHLVPVLHKIVCNSIYLAIQSRFLFFFCYSLLEAHAAADCYLNIKKNTDYVKLIITQL